MPDDAVSAETVGTVDEAATSPPSDAQPLSDRARLLVGNDPDDSDETHDEVVTLLLRGLAAAEPDAAGLLAAAHLGRG